MELFKTRCSFCTGVVNLQRDSYFKFNDKYYHRPACVEAQKEQELQRQAHIARTVNQYGLRAQCELLQANHTALRRMRQGTPDGCGCADCLPSIEVQARGRPPTSSPRAVLPRSALRKGGEILTARNRRARGTTNAPLTICGVMSSFSVDKLFFIQLVW